MKSPICPLASCRERDPHTHRAATCTACGADRHSNIAACATCRAFHGIKFASDLLAPRSSK